jgi:hypothetical protein
MSAKEQDRLPHAATDPYAAVTSGARAGATSEAGIAAVMTLTATVMARWSDALPIQRNCLARLMHDRDAYDDLTADHNAASSGARRTRPVVYSGRS